MKLRYSAWCAISAVSLVGLSCREKPKTTAAAEVEEKSVVEKAIDAVKEKVAPEESSSLSAEERAAKLGFAKYLPANTEMAMSFYNAQQSAEQLKALKLYGIIEKNMGMNGMGAIQPDFPEEEMLEDEQIAPEGEQAAEDDVADAADQPAGNDDAGDFPENDQPLPDEMVAESGPSPWTLLGQEVTIALGKTTGEQAERMLTVQHRLAYFQARALGYAAQEYAKNGDSSDFADKMMAEMESSGLLVSILEDEKSGTDLLDKMEMPPIYIAFRAKEGELEQAAQLVSSGMQFFGMAGEMAEPTEFETGGANFNGYKLLGAKVAETLEAQRESMEKDLSPETVSKILSALSKKNLIVVTGTVGDYVVVMIGGNEDLMVLADDVKSSLVATDELEYSDPFADKQLLSIIHGKKDLWDELTKSAGWLGDYAIGLRDGMSGGGGLGDTRDIEDMLQIIVDRENELIALGSSSDLGMIAYIEDGLKIESFGGYDSGSVDWNAPTTLSHLGDSSDNLLFINAPSNAAYDEKMGQYIEAIVETAYAMTVKFTSLDIEAPELAEVKEYTQMFDEKFRSDVLGLYDALTTTFTDGLGNESAVVVDLKGAIPAIPGVPQEIIDQGRAPRITMIAPVTDREKLAKAWDEMNIRTTSILAKVSEMAGDNIPMQKPMSSESNGMITWFFPFPFFQDDFLPSVTLNDKWFAASTSKTQASELISKAEAGGEKGEGVQLYVNFNALTEYADEMMTIADKNSAVLFKDEYDLDNFNRNKVEIREVIEACRQFDSLSWTARKEGGYNRHTIHFKTK